MNEYDAVALCVAILGCVLVVLGVSKQSQPLPMRLGKILIGVCSLSWGLVYFVDLARAAVPPTYASEGEFLADQEDHGFILIGKFDVTWPATYVDELVGENQISFVRHDGTPHEYSGFSGYRLKVVRLRDTTGNEPIFVLRSRLKK